MITVAILEDEEKYLDKEEKIIEEYFKKKMIDCQVMPYQNAEWFLLGLKDELFDLYILDVEMPYMNGIEVAKKIRKLYPDPVIIFITNYLDYAIEAYEVDTYRYIPKEVMDKKLPQALDALMPSIIRREEQYYVAQKRGEVEKLAYSDIYYMKKEGKYVVIVHSRGETRIRESLAAVYNALGAEEFIVVDKSYVVNIRHIMKLKGLDLIMRDEMAIPVSNARQQQVKKELMKYWRL